jgi:GTP cyclohydrolase II
MQIAGSDRSVLLLYFCDHEAQGLGLEAKVQYTEREKATGASFAQLLKQDRVDALPDVLWTVGPILSKLRFGKRISLMTKSMEKAKQLKAHGADVIDVEKDWDAPCVKNSALFP